MVRMHCMYVLKSGVALHKIYVLWTSTGTTIVEYYEYCRKMEKFPHSFIIITSKPPTTKVAISHVKV
jgi:hypothetical protein